MDNLGNVCSLPYSDSKSKVENGVEKHIKMAAGGASRCCAYFYNTTDAVKESQETGSEDPVFLPLRAVW